MEADKWVALGMSGGVDSSTTAALLTQAGYQVLGVTCVFASGASSDAAVADAAQVCAQLGIEHVTRDCTADFSCSVVQPFIDEYRAGRTPIPCVHCNAVCKLPALLAAADSHGCAYVATGHYARIEHDLRSGRYVVKRALDERKDQSYMLALLSQDQLARFLTPLGTTTKTAVRREAAERGLATAERPESQDVCFIDGDYRDFLAAHGVQDAPGDVVDQLGKVVGRHTGLFNYTVGQRKGIGIAADRPYYVVAKRARENQLVVGFKDDAFIEEVRVRDGVWQAFERLEGPLECDVKLRYRTHPVACTVQPDGDGALVRLHTPQPTTAPGQCAVFSLGDTVLGGATIEAVKGSRIKAN